MGSCRRERFCPRLAERNLELCDVLVEVETFLFARTLALCLQCGATLAQFGVGGRYLLQFVPERRVIGIAEAFDPLTKHLTESVPCVIPGSKAVHQPSEQFRRHE